MYSNVCEAAYVPLQRLKRYPTIHYENMPIQIYWKFHHQKMNIFR